MKTIWKYPLSIMDSQVVVAPEGAEFLSVTEQAGSPMLYALVDPKAPMTSYEVQIRGTGHPVDEALLQGHVFLGTVSTNNGLLVWHVFVERRVI